MKESEQCIVVERYSLVGFVHIVNYGISREQYDEMLSIFLPATGFLYQVELSQVGTMGLYWSSTVNDTGTCEAINAISERFTSTDFYSTTDYRCAGLTIRPVSN